MATVLPQLSIYIKYQTVEQLTNWKRDKVRVNFLVKKFFVTFQEISVTNENYFLQPPTNACYFKQSFIIYSTKAFRNARNFGVGSRECDYKLK